ncbi:leucine-rich repeat-containing protein 74B isoform X2 [Lacerta agilis]|uniref:leucine-rich repeat-containing protein 74B isoform X2 n=1 Tax=Lacerta agilis TaxID=80427 RepID=UPI0014194D81|nr:leucine-rich repeat-containing protein 74B isoform X2 [Lacerta agilis]
MPKLPLSPVPEQETDVGGRLPSRGTPAPTRLGSAGSGGSATFSRPGDEPQTVHEESGPCYPENARNDSEEEMEEEEEEEEERDEDWDTDLEIEDSKTSHDPTGKAKYLKTCRMHGVVPISYFLRHMKDSELTLKHYGLGPKGAKALAPSLANNTSIVKLNLSDNWLNGDGAAAVAEMLKENCYISGGVLGAAIAENVGLKELDLSWNHFRGKGAVAIAKGLGANIFLRVLDLSYNGFGNGGAAALGEALKVNNVLEELNVGNNRISLEGALCLALGLKENKTLKIFSVARNPIQSDGCIGILKALQANPGAALEVLDFSEIVVKQDFAELCDRIQVIFPSLQIKHNWSSRSFKTDPSKVF